MDTYRLPIDQTAKKIGAICEHTEQHSFSLTADESLRLLWSVMLMANGAHGAAITSHNFLAHSEFPEGTLS
jgi:hypothetical protein